ncbi:hypothetical protein REPUB_Repub15cG0129800 [Reevesia pubescens]
MEGSVEETAKAVSDIAMDSSASSETKSKNALKKELKNKQREEERRRKEEEKAAKQAAAKASSQSQKSAGADDEDMDPTQFHENRLKFLASQKAEGQNPYPHKFFTSMSIIEYIDKYGSLGNGEHIEDATVSLAGN